MSPCGGDIFNNSWYVGRNPQSIKSPTAKGIIRKLGNIKSKAQARKEMDLLSKYSNVFRKVQIRACHCERSEAIFATANSKQSDGAMFSRKQKGDCFVAKTAPRNDSRYGFLNTFDESLSKRCPIVLSNCFFGTNYTVRG